MSAADNTAENIIKDALRDAGKFQIGQTIPDAEMLLHMRSLRDLINLLQIKGLKLWLQSDQTVSLTAGQGTYDIMPGGDVELTKPLEIRLAYYLSSEGSRRPINVLSWSDWLGLGSPESSGAVNSVFVDKRKDRLRVVCWPNPDTVAATGALHVLIRRQVSEPVEFTDELEFPIEWRMALRWGLAAQLCTGQPDSIVQRCEVRAREFEELLSGFDKENTTIRFGLDLGASQGGAFR